MKRYIILTLLTVLLLPSCYEDKGNYNYRDINDVQISGVETSYTVPMDIGSLNVSPVVTMAQFELDDPRFEYTWVIKSGDVVVDTISRTREVNWPATLPVGAYNLYFKIRDKITSVTDMVSASLTISTYHGRGIMLTGENEQGNAQAQMIVMLQGQEPVFYDDILQNSGLPTLQGPISFFHSGNLYSSAPRKIWMITKSGSYFMNNLSLKAEDYFCTFDAYFPFYPGERINPVEIAPIINAANGAISASGYCSYVLCSNGDIYASSGGSSTYDQPINILPGTNTRVAATGPLLFGMVTPSIYSCIMWYDKAGERFITTGMPSYIATSNLLVDKVDDIFPWNQNGRTYLFGDNTRMTDQSGAHGNSFAIMRETTVDPDRDYDYCIYKLSCNAGAAPTYLKQAIYYVEKDEAPLFGSSPHYTFSSNRSVVFYIAEGELYGYDFNPTANKNYPIPLADDNEVTMVKYDRQREPGSDYLYVATYSAATGGTLYKYSLNEDKNTVKLDVTPLEKYTGLAKITNMSWRGGE